MAQTQVCSSRVMTWCLLTGKIPWTTSLYCRRRIPEVSSVSSTHSRVGYPSASNDQQHLGCEWRQDARLLPCVVWLGVESATWQLQGKPSYLSFWRPPSDESFCLGGERRELAWIFRVMGHRTLPPQTIISDHAGAAELGVAALEVVTSCRSQGKHTYTTVLPNPHTLATKQKLRDRANQTIESSALKRTRSGRDFGDRGRLPEH